MRAWVSVWAGVLRFSLPPPGLGVGGKNGRWRIQKAICVHLVEPRCALGSGLGFGARGFPTLQMLFCSSVDFGMPISSDLIGSLVTYLSPCLYIPFRLFGALRSCLASYLVVWYIYVFVFVFVLYIIINGSSN